MSVFLFVNENTIKVTRGEYITNEPAMPHQLFHLSSRRWHVTTTPDCDPYITKKYDREIECYYQAPVKVHTIKIVISVTIALFK